MTSEWQKAFKPFSVCGLQFPATEKKKFNCFCHLPGHFALILSMQSHTVALAIHKKRHKPDFRRNLRFGHKNFPS